MQRAVESRDIKAVFHFTRISNVGCILTYGLIPRETLDTWSWRIPPTYNDAHRLDRQEDASCCSIGHPNYKMFYGLRRDNPTEKWAVLAIKPNILWEKDCAFCVENAANNRVTSIPIGRRKGLAAFNTMFDEIPGKPDRATMGIPAAYPTNPQAEILVFDTIQPSYIIGAFCETAATATELQREFPNFQFAYKNWPFSYRFDWRNW